MTQLKKQTEVKFPPKKNRKARDVNKKRKTSISQILAAPCKSPGAQMDTSFPSGLASK
jgi:hypothetical protein